MSTSYKKNKVNINDSSSVSGTVRHVDIKMKKHKLLVYGPYKKLGKGHYKADFKLKATNIKERDKHIAKIDIFSRRSYALKYISGKDISTPNKYETFTLYFYLPVETDKVEFRVKYMGNADLYVDTIDVKKLEKDLQYSSLNEFSYKQQKYRDLSKYPGIECIWNGYFSNAQYIFDWIAPDGKVVFSNHILEITFSENKWYPYLGPLPFKKGKWKIKARKISHQTQDPDLEIGTTFFTVE